MNILNQLLATLPSEPVQVRKIIIGVHWTLVSSKQCGLSSTLTNCGPHGHSHIRDVGLLHQKSAQELANWILSDNLLEASIGSAALNSLLDVNVNQLTEINAADIVQEKSQNKNLVVVGHFPFVEKVKPSTKNCWVIEKRPFGDDFPEEAAKELIPQADVVAITGTAFINHSITGLLALCQSNALVMVLGSSTPLSPLLFDHGISFLSGSHVYDEDAVALTVQQGAAFPQVKGVRLVTLSKEVVNEN